MTGARELMCPPSLKSTSEEEEAMGGEDGEGDVEKGEEGEERNGEGKREEARQHAGEWKMEEGRRGGAGGATAAL
eukprot:38424-Rhodomonas_salina.1